MLERVIAVLTFDFAECVLDVYNFLFVHTMGQIIALNYIKIDVHMIVCKLLHKQITSDTQLN
jgi:hypothetical protein